MIAQVIAALLVGGVGELANPRLMLRVRLAVILRVGVVRRQHLGLHGAHHGAFHATVGQFFVDRVLKKTSVEQIVDDALGGPIGRAIDRSEKQQALRGSS